MKEPEMCDVIEITCENPKCKNPFKSQCRPEDAWSHVQELDLGPYCPSCERGLACDEVRLSCPVCSEEAFATSLDELQWIIEDGQCQCNRLTDGWLGGFKVENSLSYVFAEFDHFAREQSLSNLYRDGRTDYWEVVTHFCTPQAFASIVHDGVIKGSNTGYHSLPAVCLTDTPENGFQEFRETYGTFGFQFRKKDILAAKGAPALYLPQSLIDEMKQANQWPLPSKLKPYLNKVATSVDEGTRKYDWLHDREWRFPGNLTLSDFEVVGVVFEQKLQFVAHEKELWQFIMDVVMRNNDQWDEIEHDFDTKAQER